MKETDKIRGVIFWPMVIICVFLAMAGKPYYLVMLGAGIIGGQYLSREEDKNEK